MSEIIKCLISIDYVIYPSGYIEAGSWAAFKANIEEVYEGEPKTISGDKLMLTGKVPEINYYDNYVVTAKFKPHEKYGNQYELFSINKLVDFSSEEEQRVFLEMILTDNQINNLYDTLDNPFEYIKNEDLEKLQQVKGIGEINARRIVQKYKDNIDNGLAYVELDSLGLTKYMIDKLVDIYGSPDILVEKIRANPYILIDEVDGIGWKRADEMALNAGIGKTSIERISSYIIYYLKRIAEDGDTWATPQELIQSAYDLLELETDDADTFREALYKLKDKDKICWDETKSKISLKKYFVLEEKISANLKRLMEAQGEFDFSDQQLKIKQIEEKQGWDFTEEQMEAIKLVAENQVSIITGYGGTGKSSVVNGVLQILSGYSFAQTALSGRAASRLGEITNETGFTIHRLLDYSPEAGFRINKENPLEYDIIILDEISMVGADLFERLLEAMPSGSKLIMLGDDGQLESIGLCNIFKDMLDSDEIPVARLTQIHRQAQKSAIITESIKVRNHHQLVDDGWIGKEIRGELRDLELDIFGDSILTSKKVIDHFTAIYNADKHIEDIQIVLPMKLRGNISTLSINSEVQEIVNPCGGNPIEINQVIDGKPVSYTLREKDKVIVNRNNYRTRTVEDELCPIFNGNQGVIKEINPKKGVMIVDFMQWGEVVIKRDKWKTIELAYALTCHKLQGSEAKNVIVGLDFSGRALLTKEWLYTAITRASKYCVICAETKALSYCITNSNIPHKRTFLKDLLQDNLQMAA